MTNHVQRSLWYIALLAGVLIIYLPGLGNELVFDDSRLDIGDAVLGQYGSLLELKQRLLSYGSFVWLGELFGEGWWKQRIVNLTIHFAVVVSLLELFRVLTAQVRWPEELTAKPHFEASRAAAVFVGVACFAFNPVAVHAVAYLIQRSIVMATLFVVLSCLFFVRGLLGKGMWNHVLAVFCYACAVLSKEHAVMAPALAVPLYLFLRRPNLIRLAMIGGAGGVALAVVAFVLHSIYGSIIGVAFDELSKVFVAQLKALDPEIEGRVFQLSVLNQMWLFLRYGFLWLVPHVGWMSIDLRPPFPLSFASFPHVLGPLAYLALVIGSAWLLLRSEGPQRFVGLCLSIPVILFATEFATVWVQDPFVLYRSYLWAIAVPGLVLLLLVGSSPKVVYLIGLALSVVLIGLSLERIDTFRNSLTVWTDAIDKLDDAAPQNAVGRWRPYLNRGAYYLEHDQPERAYADFQRAEALGESFGSARFNQGVSLQIMNRIEEAVAAFDGAEQQGLRSFGLYYHRGAMRGKLRNFAGAIDDLEHAIAKAPDPKLRAHSRVLRGDVAMQIQRFDVAVEEYGALVREDPQNYEVRLGLAMARLGKQELDAAGALFDRLLQEKPHHAAYYGRAIWHRMHGRSSEALADLNRAVELNPKHPGYRALRQQFQGVEASAGQ